MSNNCVIGRRIGKNGYARLPGGQRGVYLYAHRVAWEETHGSIPAGMHVHHVCEVKACVNVAHMELLTAGDHLRRHHQPRKCDHSDRYVDSRGHSVCRVCRRENEMNRYYTDPVFRAKKIARAAAFKRRRREEVIA